jgi:hypothetical protein
MGFEYRFKLAPGDLDTLARNPDGIASLDALLRSLPEFRDQRDNTYFYGKESDPDRWPSTITMKPTELLVCIYSRADTAPGPALLRSLMDELLDRCGHVDVENA